MKDLKDDSVDIYELFIQLMDHATTQLGAIETVVKLIPLDQFTPTDKANLKQLHDAGQDLLQTINLVLGKF